MPWNVECIWTPGLEGHQWDDVLLPFDWREVDSEGPHVRYSCDVKEDIGLMVSIFTEYMNDMQNKGRIEKGWQIHVFNE